MTLEPSTLDIPYARKVLEHLIAHPEEHKQCYFGARSGCATVACIAGTTVLMDPSIDTVVSWNYRGDMELTVDGRAKAIDDHAAHLLGLNVAQAYSLFYNMDEPSALDQLASYIADAEQHQSH